MTNEPPPPYQGEKTTNRVFFVPRNGPVTIASDDLIDNAFLSTGAENPISLERAYKGLFPVFSLDPNQMISTQLTSSATLSLPGTLLTPSIATSISLWRAIPGTLSTWVRFVMN